MVTALTHMRRLLRTNMGSLSIMEVLLHINSLRIPINSHISSPNSHTSSLSSSNKHP